MIVNEGRMINRFGKVRSKFQSVMFSDGLQFEGYDNY